VASNPVEHSADVVRYGHQASTDRAKAIAAQQVQIQGAQQCQHLNAIAVAVAVGVFAQLGVSGWQPGPRLLPPKKHLYWQ